MGVLLRTQMQGSIVRGPLQASSVFPSGQDQIALTADRTYAEHLHETRTINSPTTFLDLLAGMSISAVRFLYVIVSGGIAHLRITTADGANQLFPVSDRWLFSNPNSGSEITALAVEGSGVTLEYWIDGDS